MGRAGGRGGGGWTGGVEGGWEQAIGLSPPQVRCKSDSQTDFGG